MLVGKLGALVRRSKTFTLSSHPRGLSPSFKASNEQYSRLRSLRSSACRNSLVSRYCSLYGFKFMSKNLNVRSTTTRKMTPSAAVLHSAKAEAANSGIELLVVGPHHAQKWVGIWLYCCAFWVFNMILLSRGSRLAHSTLSITDRKFTGERPQLTDDEWDHEFEKYDREFTGERPQLTDDEWDHEFEKYMQSPGYKCVKSLFSYKFIHWAAYAHQMMGKGLGVVFGLPFAYFLAKGYITRPLGLRLSLLFVLGGAQGLFGCLPIFKSGTEEPASEYVQPKVSPYRYAMHITSAFILYGGLFWTAQSVLEPEPSPGSLEWVRSAAKLRKFVLPVCALVGLTALSGAFAAGNHAGRAFNAYAKMGDTWIPDIPDDFFNTESLIRNFFDMPSTVAQWIHTSLAITTTTLLSIVSLRWAARNIWAPRIIKVHPGVIFGIAATLATSIQVTPGITYPFDPISLHLASALVSMSCLIFLVRAFKKPSPRVLRSLTSQPNIKSWF